MPHFATQSFEPVSRPYVEVQDNFDPSIAATAAHGAVTDPILLPSYHERALDLTSQGRRPQDIAHVLSLGRNEAREIVEDLIEVFGASNGASMVYRAIQSRTLEVEIAPDPRVINEVTKKQAGAIGLIAAGFSTRQIAQIYGRQRSTFKRDVIRPVFAKLQANNPAHVVRRSHEIGLLKLGVLSEGPSR